MTDRGLPIVDGAQACPFVAFEDDRESRATSPDQRHRCYAEVRPAPRAQAHQDAYCLSSAFATCPTFREWARREAARVRDVRSSADADLPTQRNPQRGWAAPPPWMGAGGRQAGGRTSDAPGLTTGQTRTDGGLAGSLAHRIAMDGAPLDGRLEPEGVDWVDPRPALVPPEVRASDWTGGSGPSAEPPREDVRRGTEPDGDGSPLQRVPRGRDPDPSSAAPARPSGVERPRREPLPDEWETEPSADTLSADVARWARPDERGAWAPSASSGRPIPRITGPIDDDDEAEEATADPVRRSPARVAAPGGLARVGSLLPGDHRPKVGDTRPRRRGSEAQAPPWERPHRYEAYPTLKTRMGLGAVPRVGILAIALVLAAVGLFFLPTLLGIGNPAASPGPSGSAARSAGPAASAAPSVAAAPTAQTYEVQPGDTMSRIATKFGVPLTDLVEANKEKYPNPDRLAIGDVVVIPAPAPTSFSNATPTAPPATKAPTPSRR